MATISQNEDLVAGALKALMFVDQPNPPGKVGSPPVFKVTQATLDYLKGKTVTVASDGSVTAV